MPLALRELFALLAEAAGGATVAVSYLELYNEVLQDLLAGKRKVNLSEKEGHFKGDWQERDVTSLDEALKVIRRPSRHWQGFRVGDCSPYSHVHVRRETLGVSIVQGPFSVAPCQP